MNEPMGPGTACLSRDKFGSLDVNGMKGLLSALDVKANRIDNAVDAVKRIRD
jgi:hypothetical protein